jgi:O-antigen/teichoic acid export membrane protein
MVQYGTPFIPTGILLFILNFSDRYFLRMYADLHAVGLYALGYKMGMIVSILIAGPFNLVWSAYMFELEKKGDPKPIFARVFTYQVFAMLVVALSLSVLSREIVEVIADKAYLAAYTVIPLISLSMVLQCANDVLQTGVLITRKTYALPFIVGIAAATNIGLNILLIPRYSMMGAAVATAISYGVQVLATYVVASKIYYIPFEWRRIGILFLSGFLVYGLSTLIRPEGLGVRIALKSVGLLLFPGALLVARFFHASELHKARDISSAVVRALGRK